MFRNDFPDYGILTEVIGQGELVTVKATIIDSDGKVRAIGHAEEDRSHGKINKTSALENAETSAVGRALAFFGLAGTEIASADEVHGAINAGAVKEATEAVVAHVRAVDENLTSVLAIKEGIASGDLESAAEAWFELDQETMKLLWLATTKGGIFTTKERDIMKNQFTQFKREKSE